ncbi:hypothetical protein SSS_08376 [Sarcoptes scabiei]|uniref:CCHC-type domain-containing protein n=1 Tax=Sarcoptes scabiei TaxID=52283 RepID=A0A834RH38_SARSC|nr:hypothetical protein SSS_08376 [Sarcoptes scabiei]
MLTRSFLKKNKEKMSNDLEYFDEICDDMSSSLTGLDRDVTAAIVSAEEAKNRLKEIIDTSTEAVAELKRSSLSRADKRELMPEISLGTDELLRKLSMLNEKINKLKRQEDGKGNGEGSSSYNGSEGDSDYDPERFDSQLYASMRPFSGEFLAFPQFWSMFCAYVDQTRISDVRKFQCLLDKVDEQTKAKLIGYSARNYGQAKERLMSFYLNENRLQREIIQRIDDFGDDLDMSNKDVMLKFVDVLNTVEIASDNARDSVTFKFHILEAIRTKLPNWMTTRMPDDETFISSLIKELCSQIEHIEIREMRARNLSNKNSNDKVNHPVPNNNVNQETNNNSANHGEKRRPICNYCKKVGHLAKDCQILARKNNNGNPTVNQPRPPREIKCFKCGENGHFREQCRATIAANVVETSNVNTQLTQREQCHPIEPKPSTSRDISQTLPYSSIPRSVGPQSFPSTSRCDDVQSCPSTSKIIENRPCQSKYIEVGTRIHCVQCELAEPFTYGTSAYVEGKKIDFLLDTGSKVNLMPLAVAERENLPISTMEQPFRCGAGGVHHSTFMYGDWNTRIGQITIMLRFFILPNYDRTILAETNIKLFRLVLEDDRVYQRSELCQPTIELPKSDVCVVKILCSQQQASTSKKESSPHRSFPNSDVKMNQKLSSDIVKVRKRNQSTPLQVSKVNLYSMMLIFSLATIMSEKISIHKNEPILWKQTPYHVVEHKNYNIIRLLLVSPCEILKQQNRTKTFIEMWDLERCDYDKPKAQIKYDEKYAYAYCLGSNLEFPYFNITCENSVYRIPRNTTFTINGSNTELSLKERIIEKIHQSYSSNSSKINHHLFQNQTNYDVELKELDKLLQGTEIPVYFAENHGNHTLWIILIIIIMAALVSVFIFFKFYSRSFKTETQLSSRDPRGYQTSLSSRRRNLRPRTHLKKGMLLQAIS